MTTASKCKLCGMCCRVIVMQPDQTLDRFWARAINAEEHPRERENAKFIYEHWRVTSTMWNDDHTAAKALVYSCDLLGQDNRCTNYERRPPVCSGFPLYKGLTLPKGGIVLPPGCGFARSVKP